LNTIEEYYEIAENGLDDHFSIKNSLFNIANQSVPEKALPLLVEGEILNDCSYRKNEFIFWLTFSNYKIEKLGFIKFEDFTLTIISYLKQRLMTTNNKLLKAKYNHTLWHSSEKSKHLYGQQAIENYISHLSDRIKSEKIKDKECGNIIDYLRSVDELTKILKHNQNEYRNILSEIIKKRNFFPAWFVFYTIEIIYPRRKEFEITFNQECFAALKDCFQKEDANSIKEDMYSLALKYGTYLNTKVLDWHDLMGYYYFSLASNRKEGNGDFLIPEYYALAINYFKLSENSDMHLKLSADFQKVKSANKLPMVSFTTPIPEAHSAIILNYRQTIKQRVESSNTEELTNYIGTSEHFIPHLNTPETKVPFLDYAQGSYYDKNNNFTHVASSSFINPKTLELQIFIMDALKDTFKHSIATNKLTADIFVKHLENKSWIGQNEESKYWIILLKPGIINFFSLYKNTLAGNSAELDDLIITFDTLAIKIEGIIRTYAKLNNVNITKIETEKGTGGKTVETREAFMHELFTDQYLTFKNLFDEKEYEFLKYLYLKGGLNIRNDIAHSFYKPESYSLEKLLLVVLSIFRISHFDIKKK
jgi:hypothetical protein